MLTIKLVAVSVLLLAAHHSYHYKQEQGHKQKHSVQHKAKVPTHVQAVDNGTPLTKITASGQRFLVDMTQDEVRASLQDRLYSTTSLSNIASRIYYHIDNIAGVNVLRPDVYPPRANYELQYRAATEATLDLLSVINAKEPQVTQHELLLNVDKLTPSEQALVRGSLFSYDLNPDNWLVWTKENHIAFGFIFDPYIEINGNRMFIRAAQKLRSYQKLVKGPDPQLLQSGAVDGQKNDTVDVGELNKTFHIVPSNPPAQKDVILSESSTTTRRASTHDATTPSRNDEKPVLIPLSHIYTLDELSELLMKSEKSEVYAEAPYRREEIFVSRGSYSSKVLLQCIEAATGLVVRKVGSVKLFAVRGSSRPARELPPLQEPKLLAEFRTQLLPLGLNADLNADQIPFTNRSFLNQVTVKYSSLTAKQKEFVIRRYADELLLPAGTAAAPEFDPSQPIVFGSSFLSVLFVYNSVPKQATDQLVFNMSRQVYYDYSNRISE